MAKYHGYSSKTEECSGISCCFAWCCQCSHRKLVALDSNRFQRRRHCSSDGRRHWARATLLLLLLHNLLTSCSAQTKFPPMTNLASERPIQTFPAQSTCGAGTRNAYCESTTDPVSVQVCNQKFCDQTCPGRTALPSFSNMLNGNSDGYLMCVDPDTVNVRPGSSPGDSAMSFSSTGAACYLVPSSQPAVGVNGAFTITAWIWLDLQGQSQGYVLFSDVFMYA